MSRIEKYERIYLGENITMPKAVSRIDRFWEALLHGDKVLPLKPSTRGEEYLAHLIDASVAVKEPRTNLEKILHAICTGGKVDAATKAAFNDRYLKYIYELRSGVNMFLPNGKPNANGVTCEGRKICFNGAVDGVWNAQKYSTPPADIGDTVTIRYTYISGEATATSGTHLFSASCFGANDWATGSVLVVTSGNYKESKAVVTTVSEEVKTFTILASYESEAVFDNLKFEVSFEKGDTTK